MRLQHLLLVALVTCITTVTTLGGARAADQLTTPPESLNGLRPGTLTIDQLDKSYGKPAIAVDNRQGLLGLYGGGQNSDIYGWFMVENPNYSVPDLAAETAPGSKRVDLLMAIGYDGFKTEKGITCFKSEDELIKAYGTPDFAFSVPVNGTTLRELYYVKLGISFDVATPGQSDTRQVLAIYVTYPEYLQRAIDIRKDYIKNGVGQDITNTYQHGEAA
ncbi:MAG: hypothetical protein ACYDBB_00275 [Armatimonadota bacterium]